MNNRTRNTVRSNRRRTFTAAFEAMEKRQMMSATAVKSVDSAGPDDQMIAVGSTTYVISSSRSGGGWSQICSTKGPASTTKHLLDLNKTGATLSSVENLTSTADGRVFFTATGGEGSGRQLFQLNTSKGGYTQITKDDQAWYGDVVAIGNKLFLYDGKHERIVTLDSKNKAVVVTESRVTKLFQAKGQLFFVNGDDNIFRTDGSAAGTYQINGNVGAATNRIFVSNDHIYFAGTVGNDNPSLFRSDGSSGTPTKIADDFSLLNGSSAELGEYVYFSGGYYNTSPNGGDGFQLCRVKTSTGEVSLASVIDGADGAGRAEGIAAVGTNIYYTAGDGDYLNSQGTTDRELYRYDTITGINKKITTGEQLAPVDDAGDGGGTGVLSSYYFTAAPDKENFRYGTRKIYRTNPSDDSIVEVTGLPTLNALEYKFRGMITGAAGVFANVEINDDTNDSDIFFVPTPFSYIDANTNKLVIEATPGADALTIKVLGSELVMNLNGIEERRNIGTFGTIQVYMKDGDDKLTTDANVTINMSVNGDAGNDTLLTGSGNDSLLSGSGKNFLFGGNGNDRLRGSNGYDALNGGDGKDRLYGRGGSDLLRGANGVDVLYGDDPTGTAGNDTLAGDQSNDKLYGYGGDDMLIGGTQNDSLFAGDGNDLLYGQDGNDTLEGGAGLDQVFGDAGDDVFAAKDSALDYLNGGAGADTAARDNKEKGVELIEQFL